jgi:hypothetical protein
VIISLPHIASARISELTPAKRLTTRQSITLTA